MKVEQTHRVRVSPYSIPQNAPQPSTGEFMDSMVRDSPGPTYLKNFKSFAYNAFKAAPLMYLFAPNPVTAAIAVASAVDTLIKVRNGDKVTLFEAGLVALSALSGAAAQVGFTYAGNNTLQTNVSNATIDCKSDKAFRGNEEIGIELAPGSGSYLHCNIPANMEGHFADRFNATQLPIPNNEMRSACQAANQTCANQGNVAITTPIPTQAGIDFTYIGNNMVQANDMANTSVNCSSDKAYRSDWGYGQPELHTFCDTNTGNTTSEISPDGFAPVFHENDLRPEQEAATCQRAYEACEAGWPTTTPTSTLVSSTPAPAPSPSTMPDSNQPGSNTRDITIGVVVGSGALLALGVSGAIAYSRCHERGTTNRNQIYQVNLPDGLYTKEEEMSHYEQVSKAEPDITDIKVDLDIKAEKGEVHENQTNV